jgi:hypothetical protein
LCSVTLVKDCYKGNKVKELGRFDFDLAMFIETPKPIKTNRLLFERWLVQNGRGEHFPVSRPAGELALAMVMKEGMPIEEALRSVYRKARENGKVESTE